MKGQNKGIETLLPEQTKVFTLRKIEYQRKHNDKGTIS